VNDLSRLPRAPVMDDDADGRSCADAHRVARTRASMIETLKASHARLDGVVSAVRPAVANSATAPAARALLQVLKAYGIDFPATAGSRLSRAGTVAAAAEALGTRTRRVVLPADWWRGDHGHLIGFLRDEDLGAVGPDDDNAVALVRTRHGYIAHYASMERQPVTKSLATQIENVAVLPYPPLPEVLSGPASLIHFLLPAIRGDLLQLVGSGAMIALLGMLFPIAASIIVDSLIPGSERVLLVEVGVALAVVALVTFAFSVSRGIAMLRIDGRTDIVLQGAMWDRLLRLPAGFFSAYSAGELSQRVEGIASVRRAFAEVALSATVTVILCVFYAGLLLFYDVRLALIAIGLILILVLVTLAAGRAQIRHHRRQIERSSWLSGYCFQVLQGIVKLRVAGAEERAFVRWADRYADARAAIVAARRIGNHFAAFADAYAPLTLATIFAAAAYLAEARFTVGTFVAFLAAFGSLQLAVGALSRTALQVFAVLPDWERVRPILSASPETSKRAADPGRLSGAIEVAGVTFAYPDGPSVLNDVSLEIAAGEHVALVGASGSGKSTLMRILLGLERPATGTVFFDRQDLAGLDPTLVRQQIGVVTQAGRLFAGTIMENVRGATAVGLEDCLAALQAAGFGSDLALFPMGIHTPLTEGAPTLSGGQRQRILIARALVNRPAILVFDEATSALDNRTQAAVTQSLERLRVTRLIIAHRLSTVRAADRIHVMLEGRIAESGRYDELIALNGRFASFARRQLT
jgi:ATP-binding cassette subfamily C protein